MCTCRKILIVWLLAVLTFLLAPVQVYAREVSAAAACKSPDSHPDASKFYDKVGSFPNWDRNFYLKYERCKEKHYERAPDGKEYRWIDSSDIHYHVGHGGPAWDDVYDRQVTAIKFEGDSEDTNNLVPGEAAMDWGDQKLEWIGFRCCQLLNDSSWYLWAKTMNQLHLILGFKTNSYVADEFGEIWAKQMRRRKKHSWWWPPCRKKTKPGKTVTQAWFIATDKTQSSRRKRVVARVIAEVEDNFRDHLHGNGYVSPTPAVDDVKFVLDHTAGSPNYLDVNGLGWMYIYDVVPRDLNELYIRDIGEAFGMSAEEAIIDLEDDYIMTRLDDPCDPNSSAHVLEVSKASGQYYYHDLGKLWDPNLNRIGFPADPYTVAYNFLDANNLRPADVGAHSVELEYINEVNIADPCAIVNIGSYPQHYCVVFARELNANNPGQPVSVAGPGALLKVYIDENGKIIGAMGNWREVNDTPTDTVPVMSSSEAWDLYLQYKEDIAIAPVYADYNYVQTNVNTATLAYYENSGVDIQKRLIPVWIFDVNYFTADDDLVTEAYVYIPVDESFCPPVTNITSPEDPCEITEGQTIQFRCSADSNFARPCTYEWESDADGVLSNAQNFDTNSLSVSCVNYSCHCEVVPHTITLTVTDANSLESVDTVRVTVNGTCRDCRDCADLNRDGTVNMLDFAEIANSWLAISYQEN